MILKPLLLVRIKASLEINRMKHIILFRQGIGKIDREVTLSHDKYNLRKQKYIFE